MQDTREVQILDPLKQPLNSYICNLTNNYLFTTAENELITKTAFNRMWERIKKAAGTPNITPHMFRHAFATMLYNANIGVKTSQQLLGYIDVKTTLGIYTHISNNNIDTASNK